MTWGLAWRWMLTWTVPLRRMPGPQGAGLQLDEKNTRIQVPCSLGGELEALAWGLEAVGQTMSARYGGQAGVAELLFYSVCHLECLSPSEQHRNSVSQNCELLGHQGPIQAQERLH